MVCAELGDEQLGWKGMTSNSDVKFDLQLWKAISELGPGHAWKWAQTI